MNVQEILRDFRTKYQNTFAFTENPETGKTMLCQIQEIAEDRDRQAVLYLRTLEAGQVTLNLASSHKMLFRFPTLGTFQHGKDSFVLMRSAPHRTYTRGFYNNNHQMYNCMANLFSGCTRARWTLEMVDAAFKPKKYKPEEAIKMLVDKKARSVSLPGNWSLVQPWAEGMDFALMHGLNYVGQVDKEFNFTPASGMDSLIPDVQRLVFAL